VRFRFIAAEKATHAVPILCRCVRVTRSGFYAWCHRPESTHTRDDRRLKVLVHVAFEESKHRYGSPRIHADLLEQQEQVSRKRVVRLMQEDGLVARARKRYKLTTMSDHDHPVAANLLDRRFEADALGSLPAERGYAVVPDRREAIRLACRLAGSDRTVVIAGKGHEDYQIVGTVKHPFDDREEAAKALGVARIGP